MLKTGDILICKGKSWISRAIMRVTKGTWSHSAIVVECWGEPCIAEAQRRGVNLKDFKTWVDSWGYEYEVFRYKGDFSPKQISVKALAKCGETKYDLKTFFLRIPFRLLFKKHRVKRSQQKQNEKFICSEFTSYVWNIKIKGTHEITPQEQFDYLSNSVLWEKV